MKQDAKRYTLLGAKRWPLALALSALLVSAGPAQAEQPSGGSGKQPSAATAAQEGVVNINTATEDELVRLPGVGPSKAKKILELRKRMGKFKRVENLLRVRGIGRKTLKKLRPMLALKGQSTLQPKRSVNKRGAASQAK
jgi:competence protein ComEA